MVAADGGACSLGRRWLVHAAEASQGMLDVNAVVVSSGGLVI